MGRHSGSGQLVRDARLGFLKTVLLEPVRQLLVSQIRPFQLGFNVSGGPLAHSRSVLAYVMHSSHISSEYSLSYTIIRC